VPEPVSKRPEDQQETLRILARLDDMKDEDTVTSISPAKTSIADAMVVTSGSSNSMSHRSQTAQLRATNKAGLKGIQSKARRTATGG